MESKPLRNNPNRSVVISIIHFRTKFYHEDKNYMVNVLKLTLVGRKYGYITLRKYEILNPRLQCDFTLMRISHMFSCYNIILYRLL